MSFGVGAGDIIAVINRANKIRRAFIDAPSQFKDISDEVRSLSIVLQDVEILSGQELSPPKSEELEEITGGCRNVLKQLERVLDKYVELRPGNQKFDMKVKRAWKRLNWEPDDIRDLRSCVVSNIALLNAFQGRVISQISQATKFGVDRLNQRQEDRERYEEQQTILDWLTPIDYTLQQNDFLSRRQPGTGQWLIESKEFLSWVASSKQTLFCPGIPGAGKSILASVVVDTLLTQFQDDDDVGVAYLYFNFRRQHEQKLDDLCTSLLKQLSHGRQHLLENVRSLYEMNAGKKTRPSFDETMRALRSVCNRHSRVFIIVDALDECQVNDNCRSRIISSLFNLQDTCGLNILATSRFIPEIMEQFDRCHFLEISAHSKDVEKYVDGHMSHLPSFVRRNSDLREELKLGVVEAVDGMFLLAQLHLDSLVGKRSPKALRAALANLPSGSEAYDIAYKDAMERIEGQVSDQEELAKQILAYIICAKRRLTVVELQDMLAVEVGETELDKENIPEIEDMILVCAGLVTVEEESGIVRLVHYTTQNYFERTWSSWFPTTETDLTTICATYLSFGIFGSGFCENYDAYEKRLQSHPFYEYAAQNWGYHAREAAPSQEVLRFLENSAKVESSSQALMARKLDEWPLAHSPRMPRQITGLHLAAYFGVEYAARHLLDKGIAVTKDSLGRTPLWYAAGNGETSVAKLLLESGVDIESGDIYGQTPLMRAVERGQVDIVQMVLDNGGEIDMMDPEGMTLLSQSLFYREEALAGLLLEKGANIESRDRHGRTPLSRAVVNREGYVAVQLLNRGADITSKDIHGRTPLLWAAWSGCEAGVSLMFKNGADAETKDNDGRTALSLTAERGHDAVVRLLLGRGVDINSKSSSGRTALSWAAEYGKAEVVKLLLEQGAEIDCKDDDGRTPLSWAARCGEDAAIALMFDSLLETQRKTDAASAAWSGNQAVINVLLERGAEIDSIDKYGKTPLSWAAANDHGAITGQLLDNGANIESKSNEGWTPLVWAVKYGRSAVVQLLVDNGADLESQDEPGLTSLSWAVIHKEETVVELLLKLGADTESKTIVGQTPLMWAAMLGHADIARLLMEHGANTEWRDYKDFTPLTRAALHDHEAVVKVMIDMGASVEAEDPIHHRTALAWAAQYGRERAVALLLAHTSNLSVRDIEGRTILLLTATSGLDTAVKLLLTHDDVDIDLRDKFGSTPLSLAARKGHTKVARLLLETGRVELDSRDNFGRTPLSWAKRHGHTDMVRLLIDYGNEKGVPFDDGEPIKAGRTSSEEIDRWCDICTLSILKVDAFYKCKICNGGGFDICLECFEVGAHCFVDTHELIRRE
ncbi:ankyrin repeat-containing domain protein [Dactylonectria macrodidyma]|uniref:Ankyrin repeat-containing domain protein n=1 Tax=Dactylonectria macrodidyma TaxID=307937 RepID=A0A9P9DHB0_9HYPO|nr:ankyrin repeat-containing domain protein [Dactylonectria macrodidyma]